MIHVISRIVRDFAAAEGVSERDKKAWWTQNFGKLHRIFFFFSRSSLHTDETMSITCRY
jgi:hypothetical protein